MRIEDAGVQAREGVHIRVAHRQYQAGHAALVEAEDSEPLRVHERQFARAGDHELEVAKLCLEVFGVESDQRRVGSDERRRRDDEAAPREMLAHRSKRDRGLVVEPLADHDQRELSGRGFGVLATAR